MKVTNHYLVDLVNPDFDFTVSDYCKEAEIACKKIYENKKIPMFVGGTGMYIDSFFNGLSPVPTILKEDRDTLLSELKDRGNLVLYNELSEIDPNFAKTIHPNDSQRIIRGLSVFRFTGKTLTSYYSNKVSKVSKKTLFIAIYQDKEILRNRIEKRVDEMIKNGFVEEVEALRRLGYNENHKSMRSLGYLQINDYLKNGGNLDEVILKIKHDTKKYAKRQMTWLKKNSLINWFKTDEIDKMKFLIDSWYVGC